MVGFVSGELGSSCAPRRVCGGPERCTALAAVGSFFLRAAVKFDLDCERESVPCCEYEDSLATEK